MSTTSSSPRSEPGARRDPREAAHAVAAHLGPAAVGVHERHRAVGAVAPGPIVISPSAPTPRCRSHSAETTTGVELGLDRVERELHQEVVAGRVQLRRARRSLTTPPCRDGSGSRHASSTVADAASRPGRGRRATRRAGRARTTPAGGGRSAGCAARPRRTRRRASGISPASARAPRGSRSPRARSATAAARRGPAPRRRRPAARIASKRSAIRAAQHRRGSTSMPTIVTGIAGGAYSSMPGPNDENGRPVSSITSSARTMRRRLPRLHPRRRDRVELGRAARTRGPRPASSSARAVELRRGSAGSVGGICEVVDHRAHVEAGAADEHAPAARAPRCRRSRRGPPACVRCTDHSSAGSATSTRWCTTSARSAGVGLAVPMSRPRYTCIESSDTSSTSPASARDLERQRRLARRGRADEREVSASNRRRPGCGRAAGACGRSTSTISPRSQCGAAGRDAHVDEVAAPRSSAARARSAAACSGGCGPTTSSGSVFDGPSTSTSSTAPTRAACFAERGALHHLGEPLHALADHLGGDEVVGHRPRPRCPAGARTRTCTRRRTARPRRPRASARSRRRSRPGSPTMMSVVTARSAIAARAAASRSR